MLAIYAFVRAADDFADEPEYEGRREAKLDEWDDLLQRADPSPALGHRRPVGP